MRPVSLPPNWTLPLAGGLLLLLGWVESHTPVTLTFSSYYFIPVALAAWSGGRAWGFGFAALTGFTWLGADLAMAHPAPDQTLYRGISVVNHLLAYSAAAWVVDGLHRALQEIRAQNLTLNEALAEVENLQDLLPVCAWCRKVRGDQGLWQGVEAYLQGKGTRLTHGICPQCQAEAQREMALLKTQVSTIFADDRK